MAFEKTEFETAFELLGNMGGEVLGYNPDIMVMIDDTDKIPEIIRRMKNIDWYAQDVDERFPDILNFSKGFKREKMTYREIAFEGKKRAYTLSETDEGIVIESTLYSKRHYIVPVLLIALGVVLVFTMQSVWITQPIINLAILVGVYFVPLAMVFSSYKWLMSRWHIEPKGIHIHGLRKTRFIPAEDIASVHVGGKGFKDEVIIKQKSGDVSKVALGYHDFAFALCDEIKAFYSL